MNDQPKASATNKSNGFQTADSKFGTTVIILK